MIVAIDGPAGSGKSTVAKILAKKLNFTYLDTGAIYRMVTLYFDRKGIDYTQVDEIKKDFKNIDIQMRDGKFYLNSEDVSDEIRTQNISSKVSPFSGILFIREQLLPLQRNIAKVQDCILDGRDIATIVFPESEVKIYMDANEEIRAKRRYEELLVKDKNVIYEQVLQDLIARDYNDRTKEAGKLKIADNAIVIDTSELEINEVCEFIEKIIQEKRK